MSISGSPVLIPSVYDKQPEVNWIKGAESELKLLVELRGSTKAQ